MGLDKGEEFTLTPPHSQNVGRADIQAGAKVHEDSGGKTLREDISKL